jgi:hypothetical protein
MTALLTAVTSGSGISAALSALTSATSTFNAQAASNSSLSGALSSITGSMSNVTSHISLENSNLSLGGLSLASIPSPAGGSGQILSFASKLHSFGVDKMQLGHGDIFNGVATNDLTGDALKAALLEGKNVAGMQTAGKSAPAVSNTQAATADANASNVDSLIADAQTKLTAYHNAHIAQNQSIALVQTLRTQVAEEPNNTSLPTQLANAKAAATTAIGATSDAYDAYGLTRDKLNGMISSSANVPGLSSKISDALMGFHDQISSILAEG